MDEVRIRIWATLGDSLPRLIDEMSYSEYKGNDRSINKPHVLSWGEPWFGEHTDEPTKEEG